MKCDIRPMDDVELLVDVFYDRVRNDDLLGPVFEEALQGDWPGHLNKMYRFWHSMLLNDPIYFGNPFLPHVDLPHGKDYFDHWVTLFQGTLDQLFEGQKTEEFKIQVAKMAETFHHNIVACSNLNENR